MLFTSKRILAIATLSATSAIALIAFMPDAQARTQRAYIKKNGTYVSPHYKSNPDGRRYNNKGSRTNGGKQRDEFSNPPAYNKSRNRYPPHGLSATWQYQRIEKFVGSCRVKCS